MKLKLIACDLDGTLLQGEARTCGSEIFPLIEKLYEKGVYFVPASGRQYLNLKRLFAPVGEKLLYISENGALVMHLDRPLTKNVFEDELALAICHAVYDRPECEIVISGERTGYVIPKKESFVPYIRDEIGNNITIIDAPERISEPILKVSYFTAKEDRDKVTAALLKQFEGKCLLVPSGNEWVDFAPLGTSKGSALAVVGEKLGIAPQEMAAFGDNENDRTMLEFVGHPYLMENCSPSMQNLAAERCNRVEDTLKKILEEL